MKIPLKLLIGLLVSVNLQAQDSLLWDKTFNPGNNPIRSCLVVESSEKHIVLTGLTKNELLYFMVIDKEGNLIRERTTSFPDAEIKAIRSLGNDTYLLAGSLNKNRRKIPGLWLLNENGNTSKISPPNELNQEGWYNDISENGPIFITGSMDGKMCLLQLDEKLALKDSIFLFQEAKSSEGVAMATNAFGDIYVTGLSRREKSNQFNVWKFNYQGEYYKYAQDEIPDIINRDVCVLDNNEIVAIGQSGLEGQNQDLYLIKLRQSLSKDTSWIYPTPDDEVANSIIQLPSQHLLIAGQYTFFNARTSEFWLHWLDLDSGNPVPGKERQIGNGKVDFASQAKNLQNGDFLVCGITHDGKRRIRMLYFKGQDNPCEYPIATNKKVDFFSLRANNFVLGQNNLNYNGYILSKAPLEDGDVYIRKVKDNAAKVPGFLSLEGPLPTLEGQYCYFVEKRLRLSEGANTVQVRIGRGADVYEETREVFAIPQRPNLYILSIGIPYNDLNYTDDDARDFARVFREQEGVLFGQVNITLLDEENETTAANVAEQLIQFRELANLHNQIQPEDVLMVFLSSHGDIISFAGEKEKFYIPGSDRRQGVRRTNVDYENEITKVLETINCKKIVFIDACKSGSAKSGDLEVPSVAPFITRIANASPGLVTFSSSTSNQLSYEQDSIQNGLFTEALINAFEVKSGLADKDNNGIITISELDYFLKDEVRLLVKTLFKGTGRDQVPEMSSNNSLPDDFPLFYISKKRRNQ